jgi:hypothetical protein
MAKIIEYTVISVEGSDNISTEVNGLIDQGWVPQGGVACTFSDIGTAIAYTYSQAMVMYEA